MTDYLSVFDPDLRKTAILQNAHVIKEEQAVNQIYSLSFQLPGTDEKLAHCQPFHYFRYGSGQLYRRIRRPKSSSDTTVVTIECEHVIATLCDNVLFGSYTYGGTGTHTREVIEWILSHQTEQNWILKDCDFDFAYEYNWEQENLLNALYSVPKVFTQPYIWTFDTSVYPWRVSLKVVDEHAKPSYYIRAKHNLISDQADEDDTEICTRLYPLGYGEGINQLTIRDVNNGVPYLDAPAAVIEKYGIKEKVLTDRRYEDPETLMAFGRAVLAEMQQPALSRKFNVVDLYPITSSDIDLAEVGKVCGLTEDGSTAFITRTVRVLDDPGNLQIDLSTKSTDVASAIADMAERVRIESVYAQGATQLYQHSKDANATPEKGMIISLYFPKEMKQINKILLRLRLSKFRSYSQTMSSKSENMETSTSIGGQISTATGSSTFSGSTNTAVWFGRNITGASIKTSGSTGGPSGDLASHTHFVTIPNVQISIPASNLQHSHSIDFSQVGAHKHQIDLPSHWHYISLPPHSHSIAAGIFESGRPTAFQIYIKDELKATVDATSFEDDITMWLLDGTGMVPRDRWIDMEVRPNDNAYVIASVFVQGFVQSRGGGNY